MCVIASSPKGARQPSVDELKQMWDANPHGAGFMFVRNGAVHIRKGYMAWRNFCEALAAEGFTAEDAVVYHFRISTQGGVKPEMTHPFPLTNKLPITEMTRVRCNLGIAHNGIIPCTNDPYDMEYSDTARFIVEYLSWMLQTRGDLNDDETLKRIKKLIGWSKLAMMSTDGKITEIGYFTELDGGLRVSNLNWIPYTKGERFRLW